MKIFLSIDDTDNYESIGSGELLQILGQELKAKALADPSYITRHQLFVHEDIPYTSHNSAMCFQLDLDLKDYQTVADFAQKFLAENAAPGSDPGLCLVKVDSLTQEEKDLLLDFGRRAKKEILNKTMAYQLADQLGEVVHLSEHGGEGIGVIGAIAGCGLRLSGNDGRMKGKIYPENQGNIMRVDHICKAYPFDAIKIMNGDYLPAHEKVRLGSELKGVYLDYQVVLLVKAVDDIYETCNKKELKAY